MSMSDDEAIATLSLLGYNLVSYHPMGSWGVTRWAVRHPDVARALLTGYISAGVAARRALEHFNEIEKEVRRYAKNHKFGA